MAALLGDFAKLCVAWGIPNMDPFAREFLEWDLAAIRLYECWSPRSETMNWR